MDKLLNFFHCPVQAHARGGVLLPYPELGASAAWAGSPRVVDVGKSMPRGTSGLRLLLSEGFIEWFQVSSPPCQPCPRVIQFNLLKYVQ